MCDEHFENDVTEYLNREGVNRRQFGAISVSAGLAMLLPQAKNAVKVTESDVSIKTPDGMADGYFVHPAAGASAGVVMWPDVLGVRPAFRQMGKRLAESGYAVLVVNPYYRSKHIPVIPDDAKFDTATRAIVAPYGALLNATTHATDGKAFVAWLDTQAAVDKKRKIGTLGYCMGGPIGMRTAAAAPDRVGAVGSFHGANLVTEMPDSPHLLVPQTKAQYLIAIAEGDDMRDPKTKDVLKESFTKAKLTAEVEVYTGAMHGWCPPDSPVYSKDLAEKAWTRALVLLQKALA